MSTAYLVYGFPAFVGDLGEEALPYGGRNILRPHDCGAYEPAFLRARRCTFLATGHLGAWTHINPSKLRDIENSPRVNDELEEIAQALDRSLSDFEVDWYLVSSGD